MIKLTHKYRPKADRRLLRELIDEAWMAYSEKHFSEGEQGIVGAQIAELLERRFPVADMEVLAKYGTAQAAANASINIYDPDHQRWDCYASVKLPRPILCPQGRAHFYVGGIVGTDRDDHLPANFQSYFDKIRVTRKAWNAESRYTPERNGNGYPTWDQIAEQLSVAGAHIREQLKSGGD